MDPTNPGKLTGLHRLEYGWPLGTRYWNEALDRNIQRLDALMEGRPATTEVAYAGDEVASITETFPGGGQRVTTISYLTHSTGGRLVQELTIQDPAYTATITLAYDSKGKLTGMSTVEVPR